MKHENKNGILVHGDVNIGNKSCFLGHTSPKIHDFIMMNLQHGRSRPQNHGKA